MSVHGNSVQLNQDEACSGKNKILEFAKRSTRLSFFIAGFGLACWAPLIPFVQSRLQVDSATLGTLLLCLGLGAVIGMPLSGTFAARHGCRAVISLASILIALILPLLVFIPNSFLVGFCLLLFGISLGSIDVVTCIHGAEVQKLAGVPLLSGFHAFYSIGSLVGAGSMTLALASGMDVLVAAVVASVIIFICSIISFTGFLRFKSEEKQPLLVLPKGRVLIIGIVTMIVFLAEGAILDWSAILLRQEKMVDVSIAGTGYAVFAFAMVLIRLAGDRLTAHFGEKVMLVGGIALTSAGLFFAAFADNFLLVLASMALSGLAVGNVVPVIFSLTYRQKIMPAAQAIAAISTLGYAGVLLGPAFIGYAAKLVGLTVAFYGLAFVLVATLIFVPLISNLSMSHKGK